MVIKQFVVKLYRLGRRLRKWFYIPWNRLKFRMNDIEFGPGLKVYNIVYLTKHPKAYMRIGCNVTITSGESFNPLCRNICASICLERSMSIIEIGDDSGMSSPCIWAKERIIIGKRVKIGGDCILMDSDAHNLDYRVRGGMEVVGKITKDVLTAKTAPIVIGDDVLIGVRCIVLKGVSIGARSIIAAGSIVTRSIPADCIAGGNPCKVIRMLKDERRQGSMRTYYR